MRSVGGQQIPSKCSELSAAVTSRADVVSAAATPAPLADGFPAAALVPE
jgi:hypothetical protein